MLMMENNITDIDFKQTENFYNTIVDKMPSFDEAFLEGFKKKNKDFIYEASKAGLIPDILTDYDALADGSNFQIYAHNNKFDIFDQSRKKLTFQDIVFKRLAVIKKLEENDKLLLEKNSLNADNLKTDDNNYGSIEISI
jgi:uncharacterized protein YdgA (DUF945 family)